METRATTDQARPDRVGAIEEVKQSAQSAAERQKHVGAEKIEGIARAVHGAADELESQLPDAAGYVHDAADRLHRASASLRERSLDEMLSGFTRFAREQPAAVFGGAVLAGFALSRLLKSSGDAERHDGPASQGG